MRCIKETTHALEYYCSRSGVTHPFKITCTNSREQARPARRSVTSAESHACVRAAQSAKGAKNRRAGTSDDPVAPVFPTKQRSGGRPCATQCNRHCVTRHARRDLTAGVCCQCLAAGGQFPSAAGASPLLQVECAVLQAEHAEVKMHAPHHMHLFQWHNAAAGCSCAQTHRALARAYVVCPASSCWTNETHL